MNALATWRPTPDAIAAALLQAEACEPREACGVIIAGKFYPVKNTAEAADAFVMDARSYCALEREFGRVEAIVHSHVYRPPIPSEADRAMCEKLGLPWLIVAWPTGAHHVLNPCGWTAPLVGRQWAWGTLDCYGLIRDGMRELAGVEIPDYPRAWLWWERGENIIVEQFRDAGFRELAEAEPWRQCDVIAMRIRARVVNHLGLYLEPGHMLHHMMQRISARDVYGGFWQRATVHRLRHRTLDR